jgi:hypothetical protein
LQRAINIELRSGMGIDLNGERLNPQDAARHQLTEILSGEFTNEL